MPSPYMDMGIRAMIPASENRHARGMAKISWYGARNPRRAASDTVASSLVIACPTLTTIPCNPRYPR